MREMSKEKRIENIIKTMKPENMPKKIYELEQEVKRYKEKYNSEKSSVNEWQDRAEKAEAEIIRLKNLLKYKLSKVITLEIEYYVLACDACEYVEYDDGNYFCSDEYYPDMGICQYRKETATIQCLHYNISTDNDNITELHYISEKGNEDYIYRVTYVRNINTGKILCENNFKELEK